MRHTVSAAIALVALTALPAFAGGHVEKGKQIVHTKCKICHSITNGDEVILKGTKVGPNLWGVVGHQAGAVEGHDYSKTLVEAGEKGLVWDEAQLAAYLADTKAFLGAYLGREDEIWSRMSFRVKDEDDRNAIAAYLATLK